MLKFIKKSWPMIDINWKTLKVLILDVDGTLYDQSKLRKRMLIELLKYYIVRPLKLKELLILYHFRALREKMAGFEGTDLESEQYLWCAAKLEVPVEKVKSVVKKWIFEFPNPFLMECSYPGIKSLIQLLNQHRLGTAIYSDYSAVEKLKALDNLCVDLVVSSTDKQISCLKPSPKGLIFIMEKMNIISSECLYIGDREEIDGFCAAAARIPFINISKHNPVTFYHQLTYSFKNYINNRP
jgi:putative hydrolase of the HAD superfamily